MSSTLRYTLAGGIWALVVGFGVLLILALPSRLGFPNAAVWMGIILMVINLTSSIFMVILARRAANYKILRILFKTAAVVFGYWLAFGIMSVVLYFTVGNYDIPDWLGMTLYITAEIIAPVVLLAAIAGIVVCSTKIIFDRRKTQPSRQD